MKNFLQKKSTGPRKGGYKGGKTFGGSRTWKRDDDRGERPVMHPATCSQCGASCEVPFRPNGKKPIFCRDCFRKDEGGTGTRFAKTTFDRAGAFEKPPYRSTPRAANDDVAKQLKNLNIKMDQILRALGAMEDEGDE
ncbi:hypothetical protein HY631_03625 [Candidatus Uhrbacteria bacterium]|nr:hypothetical protein [Candidatus Uhrbacteria bacterium]